MSCFGSASYHIITRSIMVFTAEGSRAWNSPVSWKWSVAPFAVTDGSANHA